MAWSSSLSSEIAELFDELTQTDDALIETQEFLNETRAERDRKLGFNRRSRASAVPLAERRKLPRAQQVNRECSARWRAKNVELARERVRNCMRAARARAKEAANVGL